MYRHGEDALAKGCKTVRARSIKGPAGLVGRSVAMVESGIPCQLPGVPAQCIQICFISKASYLLGWEAWKTRIYLWELIFSETLRRCSVFIMYHSTSWLQSQIFLWNIFTYNNFFFFFSCIGSLFVTFISNFSDQESPHKNEWPNFNFLWFFSYNISNVISIFLGEHDNKENKRGVFISWMK